MPTDKELIGVEFDYCIEQWKVRAFVAQADLDIGITCKIVDLDEWLTIAKLPPSDNNVICISKKDILANKSLTLPENYVNLYFYTRDCILSGGFGYDWENIYWRDIKYTKNCRIGLCAFD